MSIRLRLTLLYSTIVALTLIVFGVVLVVILQSTVMTSVDQALDEEKLRLLRNARGWANSSVIALPVGKVVAPTTFVQLRLADGTITEQSDNLIRYDMQLPIDMAKVPAIHSGTPSFDTVLIDEQRFRVYSSVLPEQDRYILQIGRSLADQDETFRELIRLLIIGSGIATVAAFGIGWFLAGAVLRPIQRITQTAHTIGEERNFGRRVNYNGPNDEIGQLTTTFNDMLAALQAAYRQEAQALQAQRRFVADASHELRTPLTTIRGNIGLLRRTPPIADDDRLAVLIDMADESERMSRLVNDLLLLARADAGRPLRHEPVPLRPLLDDVCRNARLLAPQHSFRCDEPSARSALGDSDAIKQVLLILLDNAIKFTPPHGLIQLTCDADERCVRISVRDTGSGIAADALPHIFERFYRGDSARSGSGSGLGLSIARTLIEAQDGRIEVQSQPGHGSTFTIELPRPDDSAAGSIDQPAPESAPAT